jgi:anti-sigma B factor antagonist
MSTRECAGQVVVALSGELDAIDAEGIGGLITTVAVRVPWLIVDLAGLEFIDCAGMRALAAADRKARQARGGLVLAAPIQPVPRMLELSGLMTGVPVCASVEQAAGIVSPQPAAQKLSGQDTQAHMAPLPAVRPERQQEEGRRDPLQRPTVSDTRLDSP